MIVACDTFFYTVRPARNIFQENLSLDYKKLQTYDLDEIYIQKKSLIADLVSLKSTLV